MTGKVIQTANTTLKMTKPTSKQYSFDGPRSIQSKLISPLKWLDGFEVVSASMNLSWSQETTTPQGLIRQNAWPNTKMLTLQECRNHRHIN